MATPTIDQQQLEILHQQLDMFQNQLKVSNDAFWVSIVSLGISLIGLIWVIRQLGNQKNTAKADFIFDLSQGALAHKEAILGLEKLKNQSDSQARLAIFNECSDSIRNYMRFCESIMLLLESGVVSDAEIFSLFTYRILLVTHCKEVQEKFLFSTNGPQYGFCAMFALHNRLISYNKARFGVDRHAAMEAFGFNDQHPPLDKNEKQYEEGLAIYKKHRPMMKSGWW